jgi:predicted nucleic acid-binding protein
MREAEAIADSGPLISFARINELELLPRLFSKIFVPPEVWNEVTARGQGLAGAYEISQARWITIQAPDPHLVSPLSILVDAGEAETIALAQTIPDCIILLDDSRARKIAKRLKIRQIGIVGLLLRAKRLGLVKKIKPYLVSLLKNGIYIRQELIDAALNDVGE